MALVRLWPVRSGDMDMSRSLRRDYNRYALLFGGVHLEDFYSTAP